MASGRSVAAPTKLRWRFAAVITMLVGLIASPAAEASLSGTSFSSDRRDPTLLYLLSAVTLPILVLLSWLLNRKINRKDAKIRRLLLNLSRLDSAWDVARLTAMVRARFFELQNAWARQDLDVLQANLTKDCLEEWKAEIEALVQKGHTHRLSDLRITELKFVDLRNFRDNSQDRFTVCFDAAAKDCIVDAQGREAILPRGDFCEFWTFQRVPSENSWRVSQVTNQEAIWKMVSAPIVDQDHVLPGED